jgi:hypothetical protein
MKVIQNLRRSNFNDIEKNLKMDEKEDIETYFLRVDEVINAIIGLVEDLNESLVLQKVLR